MEKINKKKPISFYNSGYHSESLLERLKQCVNDSDSLLILEMNRVDLEFLKKAYKIAGNRLRIRPFYGQEMKRTGTKDYPYYTYQDILKCEGIINAYVKSTTDYPDKDGDIKRLSPLEKFITAYILTIKFAKYKNVDNWEHSMKQYHEPRSVYEIILRKNDKRIVCVGYVNLLREFLYRMGITNTAGIGFDPVIQLTNTQEEVFGHERMLIHLIDPKYNIDGVYVSDPTFDENGLTETNIKHMLMSHDESVALDPEYEIDLKSWRGNNERHNWTIEDNGLNIDFPSEKFNIPVPQETIVNAFLAVEHFFDKYMKMVDNNEYGILEYYDMAWRLNLKDIIINEPDDKIYKECLKLSLKEIMCNYRHISYYFISMFTKHMRNRFNGTISLKVDKENQGVITILTTRKLTKEELQIGKTISFCDDVDIYHIQDKPLIDQLDDIYKVCDNYIKESSKMTSNK